MSVDPEKTAKDAFTNPSSMAAKRLGVRVSPRGTSPSISDGESVRSTRSRRSPSLITSAEEAELFDQMSVATGVVLSSPKNKNKVQPTSPVAGILKHAEQMVQSFSPTSQSKSPPFPDDEFIHEDPAFSMDEKEGKKSRLDFIYNDNTFHVLAEVLVEFFEARIDDDGMIVLQPEDGEHVDRIIPESARLKFIEAVRFRLQRTPKEALTPVQLLTLQCQRLGLDKFGSENPIVAALSDSTERKLLPVVEEPEDESIASSKSSSEESGSSSASDASYNKSDASPVNDAVADDGSEVASTGNKQPQKIATQLSVSFANQEEDDAESPASQQSRQEESAEAEEFKVKIPLSPIVATETGGGGEPTILSANDRVVDVPSRSETKTPPAGGETIINSSNVNMLQPEASVEKMPTADELQDPVSGEGEQSNASSEELIESVGDSAARQQLFAELREAKQFLADSVSDETKQFWKKTVEDLKHRIRSHDLALEGTSPRSPPAEAFPQQTSVPEEPTLEGTGDKQPQPQPQPHSQPALPVRTSPVDILENNRRLLSEFHHRDPYGTPALSGSKSTASSHPISEQDYEAPMVDVVAPADLPGGYHFEAEIEGQRFLATVPPGGVQQGETFTCYMRELDSVAIDIPVGYWKDEPQDVFKYGCCHPVIWNSIFCPLIPLSQIQTRVHLDFLGRPKTTETELSNRAMMLIVMAFWLIVNLGLFLGCHIKWSRGAALSIADYAAVALINAVFVGFIVFVTQSTRSSIREKFLIREQRCYDLEDLSCSALCLPCTVAQMSRHTANYDDYEAVCCSKSGLPDGVRVNQAPVKTSGSYVV